AAVADMAITEGDPISTLLAGVLALSAGGLVGASMGLVRRALRGAPLWLVLLIWLGVGAAAAQWLMGELGVLARLNTKDHAIAVATLVTATCGALGFALVSTGFQPRRDGRALIPRRWPRLAVSASVALGVAALVALYLDRGLDSDEYPSAHIALLCIALWAATAAIIEHRRVRDFDYPAIPALAGWVMLSVSGVTLFDASGAHASAVLRVPAASLPLEMWRNITDVDRDGFSSFLGAGDCAPWNPAVNPAVREIPENGLDDNCALGDATKQSATAPESAPIPETPSPTSVVLISVDALAADRMSLYGYRRETTPNIDAWAEGATVYENAYCAGAWTTLSISAILSGLYPRRLSYNRVWATSQNRVFLEPPTEETLKGDKVRGVYGVPDHSSPNLINMLKRRGMRTVAITDDGFSEVLSRQTRAFDAFDRYLEVDDLPTALRNAKGTANLAIDELEALAKADEEFFLWVHFFDPHLDPKRHEGSPFWDAGRPDLKYAHEVHYTDRHVGRLLASIEELRARQPIAVILLADHGERMTKKAVKGHGMSLDESSTRIPLIVKAPELEEGPVPTLVSAVDVMPTVLSLTHTPTTRTFDGVSLIEPADPERIILIESWRFRPGWSYRMDKIAAIDKDFRLELNLRKNTQKLTLRASDEPVDEEPSALQPLNDAIATYLEENRDIRFRTPGPVASSTSR
ncbi:MAG: sulfatase-like hydrolase/transferase, partial [Nannocystaceae bacterium]